MNKSDKTLRIHTPKVTLSLDPHKMEDAYSMMIVGQIYRGLFRFTPEGEVRPDMVESWKESSDHLKYNLILKKMTFSDGTPITSKHVQMSFARMFHLGAAMGADFDYIKGVQKFRSSKNLKDFGIIPISELEVEFNLAVPSALFLKHLAVVDCAILPLLDFKDELKTNESGKFSGPFKIKIKSESEIQVEKWRQDQLDSKNPPRDITFFMTEEDAEALAKAGKTDSLDHNRVEPSTKMELIKNGWNEVTTELAELGFMIINPDKVPLSTREYLYSRIKTEEIVELLESPKLKPAYGVIPATLPGELRKSDLDQQKYVESPTGTVDLDIIGTSLNEQKIARYLKQAWETPKFKVNVRELSTKEKLDRLFGKKSTIIIARKGMDYPDGYSVLSYFKSGYDANYFYVSDPKVDQGLIEAVKIFDDDKRSAKYREIQKIILNHRTVVPLFYGSEASGLWSSKVDVVPSHPIGFHLLPYETIGMRK